MTMNRFFPLLSILFSVIFMLCVVGARAWGYTYPTPLLAFTNERGNGTNYTITLVDFSHHLRVNIGHMGRIYSPPIWSRDGRLAFMIVEEGNTEISVWDGNVLRNVTQTPSYHEEFPQWSPDGRLTYMRFDEIHVRAAITGSRIVVDTDGFDLYPSWSVDGRLAFVSHNYGNTKIVIWDGSTYDDTSVGRSFTDVSYPQWSVDGRLAFKALIDDFWELLVWDGTQITSLALTPSRESDYVWSPDGRLAFVSFADHADGDILVWDGETSVEISQNPAGADFLPSWSADGRLAFVSQMNGSSDIMVWDGTSLTNITQTPTVNENSPTWSADGQLAFVGSTTTRFSDIYLWDGVTLSNLTNSPEFNDDAPAWWTP